MTSSEVLWQPSSSQVAKTNLSSFQAHIELLTSQKFDNYAALHQWSIEQAAQFWREVWVTSELIGDGSLDPAATDLDQFPGTQWFPELRLNFAENLLRYRDDRPALISRLETTDRSVLTFNELYDRVEALASVLRGEGIVAGDRVAAFLPNISETIIAMLATTSIGAIWSSCSPDFGVAGATDRFGQIEPKLLFAVDAYFYNGKVIDCRDKIKAIRENLPTVQTTVLVPFFESEGREALSELDDVCRYDDFLRRHRQLPIVFERLPFNHPIYINFSSGTTGIPKCIVHGAGGTLLQHHKEHRIHTDLSRSDTLFFHTTCGWMMWNWLVSALSCGCPLVLFDGSPLAKKGHVLIDMIDDEDITVFGVSARYLASIEQLGIKPIQSHKLTSLRGILSTGSPLNRTGFEYVYRDFKKDVNLASICGGTDIISCFLLGNPNLPVYSGEIQCKGLGMAVEFWDEQGNSTAGVTGELVCTHPFPSIPVGFWRDPDNEKFHNSYFSQHPGVWTHGDYGEITESGGAIIHGRSDAVLNPSGVRIGTAEIYRQVEKIQEVLESLAIGQAWQDDERIVLFVRLADRLVLTEQLIEHIKEVIQANTTRRHVPAKIIQVADIPRTISGKIVEIAVRNVVNGLPVANQASLANPEALALFDNLAELNR
ncbi:MAG: acetoacetyl-CoA synthetase [Dinoroseobacter sp.]|jgi:acetoacetyl-CoA synthetase